jgi:hypothetical protein
MRETHYWSEMDELWGSCIEGGTAAIAQPQPALHDGWGVDWWGELDTWWDSYTDIETVKIATDLSSVGGESPAWSEIDPWWSEYSDSQREYLRELSDVVDSLNEAWKSSDCKFDRDPLTADWRRTTASAGPLRVNQEENWSQWLAHLLRSSSGEFIDRLIGNGFDDSPNEVRREIVFRDSTSKDRRIDILTEYVGRGVSIEVKIDDESYRKTLHTARLIEKQDYREWLHVLLLPRYKEQSLRATFGDEILDREDENTTITSSGSEDILVLYWEDVGLALRRTLLNDEEEDPHWEASAYLLVTLIEQRLRSFEPIERKEGDESSAVRSPDIWTLKSVDIADQISYLKRMLRGDNDE